MELTCGLGKPRPSQELRSTHRGPVFCPEPLEHGQRAEGLPDEHGDSLWATPGLGAKAPQSWGLAPHYGPHSQPASPLPLPGASHSATSHVCPTHLSKAGEVGWAVGEHVVHSCSGSGHQVRVGMGTRQPLPAFASPHCPGPHRRLTHMPQWQDDRIETTLSNQAADPCPEKGHPRWVCLLSCLATIPCLTIPIGPYPT